MNDLKKNYENACNAYLNAFCDKHGYDYDDAYWIGGKIGDCVSIGDEFAGIATIRADIDMNAPECEFLKWYDYCLRLGMIGDMPTPNYENWLRGCPRKSEEEIQKLEHLHERVEEAKAALKNAINEEF